MWRRALSYSLMLLSSSAVAWGPNGHQSVGYIADQLLAGTPTAKHVRAIIGSTLSTASVWADCARGVTKNSAGKFGYTAAGQFPECKVYENAASEKAMVGYVQRNWDNCDVQPGDEVCHKQYHFSDVALQRDAYASGLIGTSDHDVVHAISACIAVLQGKASPAPFAINTKREALRLLTHFVGDVHQPLHVVAIYLDQTGTPVDPDQGAFHPSTKTIGGNSLLDGSQNLHAEWDDIPVDLTISHLSAADLNDARSVPQTEGAVDTWSTAWATDAIQAGKSAFQGVTFSSEDSQQHWNVTLPAGYAETRTGVQRGEVIKAGAHLAELLRQLFP